MGYEAVQILTRDSMNATDIMNRISGCPQDGYVFDLDCKNQRTNGPVNAHLISSPSKAQNIQNQENSL